ncbi:MAG: hypothetical protein ACD_74C00289G0001 [uncultured bacterium]|nr:MAG: hypothetical protein ACD_74C00289G0001 [uncultured bacterium]
MGHHRVQIREILGHGYFGLAGQHAVADGADPESFVMEAQGNAGAEDGGNNGRLVGDQQLAGGKIDDRQVGVGHEKRSL